MRRLALLALIVGGCSYGAPPGFSKGDAWTVPLVGPLEDGVLLVPVFVNDKGPFLFAIDPDARVSAVDQLLVGEAGLPTGGGPRLLDESDTTHPTFFAEILRLRIGTLVVERRTAMITRPGTFNVAGRVVRGILGRDVIADSLAFGFDRDRGLAYLATQQGFHPPAGAQTISYDQLTNRYSHEVVPRRMVKGVVDGASFAFHLDLGAGPSQLREALWPKAKLTTIPIQTAIVDEVGTGRVATHGTQASRVDAGGVGRDALFFVGFEDKRWDVPDIDGTLGLDFFRPFAVWANWDSRTMYLTPRAGAPALLTQRIARWGNEIVPGCSHVGCVDLRVVDPLAGKLDPPPAPPAPAPAPTEAAPAPAPTEAAPAPTPDAPAPVARPHPGVLVTATRDATAGSYDLEVLVEASAVNGEPARKLSFNLPAGVDKVMQHLPPSYVGTTLTVIDVSPFPRPCAAGGGCIYQLAAPR
jgi:hypothetical protein